MSGISTSGKINLIPCSFLGVLLVSLSDSTKDKVAIPASPVAPMALFGDVLALLSALFYALYVILLKVGQSISLQAVLLTCLLPQIRIGSESRIDMQLFFGFVGAFNIIALIPVGIILHITGYERFSLPSTNKEWGAVLLNVCVNKYF